MLSLEDFEKYKIEASQVKGGSTIFAWTYECHGSDDAFSIMGPEVDLAYAQARCGGGFEAYAIWW